MTASSTRRMLDAIISSALPDVNDRGHAAAPAGARNGRAPRLGVERNPLESERSMAFPAGGKIWMNGTFVEWNEATIPLVSHVINGSSGVFEGARCYDTPNGSVCFRLDAHLRRL